MNHFIHNVTDEEIKWMLEIMSRIESDEDLTSSWIQTKYKNHLMKLLHKHLRSRDTEAPNPLLLFDGRVSFYGLCITVLNIGEINIRFHNSL